jgi:hypothetical protein
MPRVRDIERHLASIQAAEPGIDHAQLDVIREIIYLRRRIDSVEHMARFRQLLNHGGDELLRSLSTRWLISIADTYADHGDHCEPGNAMVIVVLASVTRMAETERLYLKDSTVDQARQDECVMPGTPLWDGMVGYAIKHGDMPINMWTRIRSLLVDTPILSRVFEIVLARMVANDTLIGRLAALNPNFYQLNEPFPYWELVD